jgi:tripartite-type tricarboxylate transporter receptor subunit TctC
MKFFIILFLFICSSVQAQNTVIYEGDPATLRMIKDIFPDSKTIAKPGGEGIPAFNELHLQPKSVYISGTTTTLISGLFNTHLPDHTKKFRLISVLLENSVVLLTSSNSKYNSLEEIFSDKPIIKLGGIHMNSACFLNSKEIERHYNVNVLYVPYKQFSQMDLDLYRGDLDLSCRVGRQISQAYSSGLVKPIADLSRTSLNFDYKVPHSKFVVPKFGNYLFASNDLSNDEIVVILQKIKSYKERKDTPKKYYEQHSEFIGLTNEKEVNNYYKNQKSNWIKNMERVK